MQLVRDDVSASVKEASTSLCFGPLLIAYDERVLRPRPWTIAQSTWAAGEAALLPDGPILELCAGAGHIGLLAAVCTGRALVAVDDNPVAAAFIRRNALAAGISGRVDVRCSPVHAALQPHECFSLVLADPPYITTADVRTFPEDPAHAIDGGGDGLDVARECLETAARHLIPGGVCLLQVRGPSQAAEIRRALRSTADGLASEATVVLDDDRAIALVRRIDENCG